MLIGNRLFNAEGVVPWVIRVEIQFVDILFKVSVLGSWFKTVTLLCRVSGLLSRIGKPGDSFETVVSMQGVGVYVL